MSIDDNEDSQAVAASDHLEGTDREAGGGDGGNALVELDVGVGEVVEEHVGKVFTGAETALDLVSGCLVDALTGGSDRVLHDAPHPRVPAVSREAAMPGQHDGDVGKVNGQYEDGRAAGCGGALGNGCGNGHDRVARLKDLTRSGGRGDGCHHGARHTVSLEELVDAVAETPRLDTVM
nr:hypothetical protein [Rathayibacter tritici]